MMSPLKMIAIAFSTKPNYAGFGDGFFPAVAYGECPVRHAITFKISFDRRAAGLVRFSVDELLAVADKDLYRVFRNSGGDHGGHAGYDRRNMDFGISRSV